MSRGDLRIGFADAPLRLVNRLVGGALNSSDCRVNGRQVLGQRRGLSALTLQLGASLGKRGAQGRKFGCRARRRLDACVTSLARFVKVAHRTPNSKTSACRGTVKLAVQPR